MSFRGTALNLILRHFEKAALEAEADPIKLRDGFERKARMLFAPPSATQLVDRTIAGVPLREVAGAGVPPAKPGTPVILYVHGGAFVMGSSRTHAGLAARLSTLTGLPVLLPDYRLAPEHRFPAACDDLEALWAGLMAAGWAPGDILLGGDSAGGALALSLLGALSAQGTGPRATFCFSPLTDIGAGGPSRAANAEAEVLLPISRIEDLRMHYLGDADPSDPRASPIHAEFADTGPVWLTVGDTEILLDDSRQLAEKLERGGIPVTLNVARDLPHVWPMFHRWLPEGEQTLKELATWIVGQLPPSKAVLNR